MLQHRHNRQSHPGQLPVPDPVGLVGSRSQPRLTVCFVVGIVAFEPDDLALPLERQNMGGDPVKKPAVMTDDHGAAGKILQGFFQGTHGVHVQVIGRFVQEEHITTLFQHLRQVDPVPFAAGEHADFFLLVGTGKVEAGDVGA